MLKKFLLLTLFLGLSSCMENNSSQTASGSTRGLAMATSTYNEIMQAVAAKISTDVCENGTPNLLSSEFSDVKNRLRQLIINACASASYDICRLDVSTRNKLKIDFINSLDLNSLKALQGNLCLANYTTDAVFVTQCVDNFKTFLIDANKLTSQDISKYVNYATNFLNTTCSEELKCRNSSNEKIMNYCTDWLLYAMTGTLSNGVTASAIANFFDNFSKTELDSVNASVILGSSSNSSYNFGNVEYKQIKYSGSSFTIKNNGNCIIIVGVTDDYVDCAGSSLYPVGQVLAPNATATCYYKTSEQDYTYYNNYTQHVPYAGTINALFKFVAKAKCGTSMVDDAQINKTGLSGNISLQWNRLSSANIYFSLNPSTYHGNYSLLNVNVGGVNQNATKIPVSTQETVFVSWEYSQNQSNYLPKDIIKNIGDSTAVITNVTVVDTANFGLYNSNPVNTKLLPDGGTFDGYLFPYQMVQKAGCYTTALKVDGLLSQYCKSSDLECAFSVTGGLIKVCRNNP